MEIIVKAVMGSQLYGLDTPESDIDYKGVYIPDAEDILLGKVPKTSINDCGKGQDDTEMYTLAGFMNLLKQGQTGALELLFAPPDSIVEYGPLWKEIQKNRDKFLHSNITSFVGYCKSQAHKNSLRYESYTVLGEVIQIMERKMEDHAVNNLKLIGKGKDQLPAPKVGDIVCDLKKHTGSAWFSTVMYDIPNDDKKMEGMSAFFLEVAHMKVHYALSLKLAIEQLKKKHSEYGKRITDLTTNADWKALSHAIRVGDEAIDLLSTGKLTFPLETREFLLKVKKGEVPFKEVSEIIDSNLEMIYTLEENSVLPKEIDTRFLDEIVLKAYQDKVSEHTIT